MSTKLLEEIQERTKRTNGTFKLQRCELNLQAYSHTGLQLKHVAPIHLTVGSMDLVHPVYVSPLKTYPLLIGKDLLNRFEPLIDFKHLKMWTQVREPLPCQALDSKESQCQVTDTAPKSLIDDAVVKPRSGSSTNSKDKDHLLCSLQEPESNAGPLRIMTAIDVQGTSVSNTALALWAENSAISLKLSKTLKQRHQCLPHVAKHSRFPLSPWSTTMATSKIICSLDIRWNNRHLSHYFLVVPDLPHDIYIGADIHVPKDNYLGWLIHDFELMVPVIGPIPTQLMSDEYDDTVTFTKPHEIIAITSILPVSRESVCRSELTDDTHLAVYAVSKQPATESPTQVTIGAQSPSNDLTAEEPYAGFNAQVQQILSEADALHNEADRQGLKEVLHKYKDSFAKDSLDCGLTNIHTVRIPTNPNAPPTFVRQYKIPIASYEPVQEIVDSMLEKGSSGPVTAHTLPRYGQS